MSVIEFDQAVVANRLHSTSLTLSEQRIGVIGLNGSGKSTLVRLINGLIEPDEGRVLVNGLDAQRQGRQVRKSVGFLFTDPGAQLVMPTVIEDISLSLRNTHTKRNERRAAALGTLDRFGLKDLAERSVYQLSGGQRQLVALASVLATAPQVLIADEPTTLLDLKNSRLVGDLLFSLDQQLILVTHDLELAARCDRVLVVSDGRIDFDGDPQLAVDHYRASA
ncbi:MAG: ABC transporter ATP-binding protein [Aeromicrobium sp.]|nr:MAG: ABC transporter ATP-binding protein [Aeromicrobium sp.]